MQGDAGLVEASTFCGRAYDAAFCGYLICGHLDRSRFSLDVFTRRLHSTVSSLPRRPARRRLYSVADRFVGRADIMPGRNPHLPNRNKFSCWGIFRQTHAADEFWA
jgi:hypothetical protein